MPIYEVVVDGIQDGQPHKNVLHYDLDGITDLQQWVDNWGVLWDTHIAPLVVPSLIIPSLTLRENIPGSVGITFSFTAGTLVGTNAETTYASLLAANVRKYADVSTKPNQGRVYQGGIPSSAFNADGYLLTTYQDSLGQGWANLLEVPVPPTGDGRMVILASNPTAPNTVAFNYVDRMSAKGAVSTQKRRNWNT
jgi:hypothetical protein